MEIDTANNMERFSTGSGADEAVEVHDFEIVSSVESNPIKEEKNQEGVQSTRGEVNQIG